MTCSAYPLSTLDTIRPDGSTSNNTWYSNTIKKTFRLRFCSNDSNKWKYSGAFGYDCEWSYTETSSGQMESIRICEELILHIPFQKFFFFSTNEVNSIYELNRNCDDLMWTFKRKLVERLALLILHLVCLSLVVYLRPTEKERLYMKDPKFDDWVCFQ